MSFIPSPQQQTFLDWCESGTGSAALEAVAGAGKTTTLLQAIHKFSGQCVIVAYNKKIAEEISGKLKRDGIDYRKCEASTVHALGFRAYRKQFPNVKVDRYKLDNIFDMVANMEAWPISLKDPIIKMASLAKQQGVGFLHNIADDHVWHGIDDHFEVCGDHPEKAGDVIKYAKMLLLHSNNDTAHIDFDDMCYLPLVHRVRFWRYDVVMVDEAQDTNPARRAMVRAILKPGGRVVAVGDRHQAIYGFTGADADSLDLIAKDFNCQYLPLTVSYRCPTEVVNFARQWVNHISSAPDAPAGSVGTIGVDELLIREDLKDGTAILCRNNKPLVNLAYQLIRRRVPCRIEGRDVAEGMKKLVRKWSTIKTIAALEDKLLDWKEKQVGKLMAKRKETMAQAIEDQVETILEICQQCRPEQKTLVSDITAFIDSIFSDDVTGMLVLSSIHKSKGREWETVFWYDREGTLPSRYARQAWQLEQETNLCYVAATRAKLNLIEVTP